MQILTTRPVLILFLTAICFEIISCRHNGLSEIENIKVDSTFIQSQILGYDSLRIDTFREDKNTLALYFFKDTSTVSILQDSLKRFRFWIKEKLGRRIAAAEVYESTGQIKGKLHYINGEIEGEAKYYYEDGRIRSKGLFKNGEECGEWRNYNDKGELISIHNR